MRPLRSAARPLLAAALAAALGYTAYAGRDVSLAVTIVDAATGRPTPARVVLEDDRGTRPHVGSALALSDSSLPIPRQAIAVMWGQQDRAEGFALQPDGAFYVDGGFDVRVPAGSYTVQIAKGFEYVEHSQTFDLASSGATREVRLSRWVDMAARGWYAADDHIHLRRSPADDRAISRWIAAEDLQVGNLLQMGDFWATYFAQYAFGASGRYEEQGRWLSPGQEDPRTPEIGHTISLGAREFVRMSGDYYAYDRLFDRVHELGGVTGFAHQGMSFHGYRGMALNTLRGKTDFLELAQYCVPEGPLATEHYYLFLDLGIRMTALAGSDFPWCGRGPAYGLPGPRVARIGNARFYTYAGGSLTFDAWLAGLKAGHTFVTTGPMVVLTVNGRIPGDTLDVVPGTRLHISAEALGHEAQVPLRSLEIVAHGRVLKRADGRGAARLSIELELPVEHGLWIAAKVQAGPAQAAHTTPVYVTVDGGGFENAATLAASLDKAADYLREIEADLLSPGTAPDHQASRHRASLERQIAEARTAIARLRAGR